MYNSYMKDCIHLHACRRVQAIGKTRWHNIPRYCSEECDCYLSGEKGNYISVEDAIAYARDGCDSNKMKRVKLRYDYYEMKSKM